MGYRGKLEERAAARRLRAEGWTMPDIAAELGVSRSSVSLWTCDVVVVVDARARRPPVKQGPNRLERAAVRHWVGVTAIPASQFTRPYRATPDAGIRHNKHLHGCPAVVYCCSRTHRQVMGLVDALLA